MVTLRSRKGLYMHALVRGGVASFSGMNHREISQDAPGVGVAYDSSWNPIMHFAGESLGNYLDQQMWGVSDYCACAIRVRCAGFA